MKFNINATTRARLTPFGMTLLKAAFDIPGVDWLHFLKPGNSIEMPLWEVMSVFGQSMFNGAIDLPFVDNQIWIDQ